MNKEIGPQKPLRFFLPSLLFYGVAIALLAWLGEVSPSGPCVPGLGVIAFLLLIPVIILLLIRNLAMVLSGHKTHVASLVLHSLVSLAIVWTLVH